MQFFKSHTWFLPLLFLCLYSCEKDESPILGEDGPATFTALEAYAGARQVLLAAMQDVGVREFIRARGLDRVTYDYEILYGMVKDERLSNGRTFAETLLAAEDRLIEDGTLAYRVMGRILTVDPLLSINVPRGIFEWDTDGVIPPIVIDPTATEDLGYAEALFADGHRERWALDALPEGPVVTIGQNERMLYVAGEYRLNPGLLLAVAPEKAPANKLIDFECFVIHGEEVCTIWTGGGTGNPPPTNGNPTCERNFGVNSYLTGIRMENIGSFETFGRPELRATVLGGTDDRFVGTPTGRLIIDPVYNPDRRDVNGRWWNRTHYLFPWYADYGSILTWRWEEVDGGAYQDIEFDITVSYEGQSYGLEVNIPGARRNDYIGTRVVDKDNCERQYSVGAVEYRLRF